MEKLRQRWIEVGQPLGRAAFAYSLLETAFDRMFGTKLRFRAYQLYLQPLPSIDTRLRAGYLIEEVFRGDKRLEQFPRPSNVIAQRWDQKSRCFLLRRDESILGFAWFCFGAYLEDDVNCVFRLRPEDRLAWDYDIFLFPEHRLGRAFQQLWLGCAIALRQSGYTHTASRIIRTNVRSVKSHRALGALAGQKCYFLNAGARQLALFRSPMRVSLSRSSDPPSVMVDLAGWPHEVK
jgi:hypothetical protein